MKHRFIIAAILVATTASAQQHFTIDGKYTGDPNTIIYLSYPKPGGGNAKDSAVVTNGKFKVAGTINGPQAAHLTSRSKPVSVDDPNYTTLFIEPGTMKIDLKKDAFKEVKTTGSVAQSEYMQLQSMKQPIVDEMKPLSDAYRQNKSPEEAAAIREKMEPFRERQREQDFIFFRNHPTSFITLYQLQFHVSSMSLDTLQLYYSRMNDKQKRSAIGERLQQEIVDLKNGSPGAMAANFTSKGIDGETISLAAFKGKYVLLDFWASWCIPCRKGNPHLIALYNKYKSKGIEFIGVADDDSKPDAWRTAVAKDTIGIWKHVLRGFNRELAMNGKANRSDISNSFGIHTLPTKILIDPTGMIIGRYGEEEDALDKKLQEIFNH